jgi:uncharacterized membrane protein YozB (DUF420 family)
MKNNAKIVIGLAVLAVVLVALVRFFPLVSR